MKPLNIPMRDKAIRSVACAAICGLSVSFAMGEYFDSCSPVVQNWQSNSEFLEISFPVASSMRGLAKALKKSDWVDAIVAANDPGDKMPESILAESKDESVKKISNKQDSSRAASSEVADIHKMLLSVHNAEQVVAQLSVPSPKRKKEIYVDRITTKAAANSVTEIHGRLLPIGSGVMNGHFEVGLYSSINSIGNPVGYPVVQQILPTGTTDFSLTTKEPLGFLFARYSSDDATNEEQWFGAQQNPLNLEQGSMRQVDIIFRPPVSAPKTIVATRALEVAPDRKTQIHGRVTTMFAHQGQNIPQVGALVKLRGASAATTTNALGDFVLKINGVDGPLLLEVVKAGYLPTIVRVGAQELRDGINIELASKDALDQMANNLGVRQSVAKTILLGRVQSAGQTAQLALHADGPYYFTKEGYPAGTSDQRNTSVDGRFIYFNVESGVGTLEVSDQGDVIPAMISAVDGGGLIYKQLNAMEVKIRGRLINPIAAKNSAGGGTPIPGAHIKFAGSSDWATTDSHGFFEMSNSRAFRGEDIALEVSAEHFYSHRFIYNVSNDPSAPLASPINLFAFPASYINMLANSADIALDPYAGVILGGVGHRSLRIDALAEHADSNNAKDYYFDSRGALKGSYAQTDKNFGTYVIFNVPKGRVLLHGLDSAGTLQYSNITYASPSTINVVVQ